MSHSAGEQHAAHVWETKLRVSVADNAHDKLAGSMDSMRRNEGAGSRQQT